MNQLFNRRSFAAVSFLLGLFFFGGLMKVNAITLYGVTTTNQLVRFDSATPGTVVAVGAIWASCAGERWKKLK